MPRSHAFGPEPDEWPERIWVDEHAGIWLGRPTPDDLAETPAVEYVRTDAVSLTEEERRYLLRVMRRIDANYDDPLPAVIIARLDAAAATEE